LSPRRACLKTFATKCHLWLNNNQADFYRRLRPIGIHYSHLASWAAPEHHPAGRIRLTGAVGYERGTARSEWGQLSANFIQRDELLSLLGEAINGLILSHRGQFENTVLRERGGWSPRPSTSPAPKTSRNPDGRTALRNTLFISMGCANFSQKPVLVHLVRDVTDVVRSLLNFFPDGRNRLVANEQAAYEYWIRKQPPASRPSRHTARISYIECAAQISPSNPRLRSASGYGLIFGDLWIHACSKNLE